MGIATYPVGTSSRLIQGYVDLLWKVYRNDSHWVPPLKSDVKKLMSRKNPFFRHADVEHFVAILNEKEVVGRIAATVYPTYIERYKSRVGFFGFFESLEDDAIADALLSAAEAWLKARNITHISGPYNYCSTQEMGLLVDGFDSPPALFQTHNPPYYRQLLERRGYVTEFHADTGALSREDVGKVSATLVKWGDAVKEKAGLSVRYLDMRRFGEDMESVRQLFNVSFASNTAVTPFEKDVFHFQVKELKPFIAPEMITIIEQAGKPVAFSMMVPNLNELLVQLNGNLRLWDLLRIRKLLGQIRSAVLLLVGALPEVHGVGIGRTLLSETFRVLQKTPYEVLHTTWIHEGNWSSRSLAAQWNLKPSKRYVLVGRDL